MPASLSTAQLTQVFPCFTEPALQRSITENGQVHAFRSGDVIMDFGGYVRMLPLILSGTIKISRRAEDGAELFLYYLNAGESCTMTFTCCAGEKKSEIRAVAEEDTVLLGLPPHLLGEWMMRHKSWNNFVMRAYDHRMNELIRTVDQIAFHQLDERLVDYLDKRAGMYAERRISTTHQAIADDLNVSREAVSRLLKGLERRGVVALGRNEVRLLAR